MPKLQCVGCIIVERTRIPIVNHGFVWSCEEYGRLGRTAARAVGCMDPRAESAVL